MFIVKEIIMFIKLWINDGKIIWPMQNFIEIYHQSLWLWKSADSGSVVKSVGTSLKYFGTHPMEKDPGVTQQPLT